MFEQCAKAAGRHHHQDTCKRQHRTGQGTHGQALAEADDRHGERHQWHQRQDDAHVGGRGQARGEVRQALIDRHAENTEDKDLAQFRADQRPMGEHRFEHEGREQQPGQQPAVETDLGGEDRPGRHFGDHGVAGPDKNGQQGISVLHREKPER
ncbi:hypothetical protein D3C86_1670580 [compost metagenome]